MMKVAVVGATGVVGRTILHVLEEREFKIDNLELFASAKSAGTEISFNGKKIKVTALQENQSFKGFDFVFFCAGGEVSRKHAPVAASQGCIVIDNSSVFRLKDEVPLVVPEINGDLVRGMKSGIIANPNCTTAQLVMALYPLMKEFGMKRVSVSSYQAVSGKGQKAIDEFLHQAREVLEGETDFECKEFAYPIAFNALPQIDVFKDDGFTGEEHKVMAETKKILGRKDLRVVATCVRVPVINAHSESVQIETEKPVDLALARDILSKTRGVVVQDDPANQIYPIAGNASGRNEVFVGRLRHDFSLEKPEFGLILWIVADNLRKGAALNAVQIAECLLENRKS